MSLIKTKKHRSFFDVMAQTGLWIILITGILVVLKPLFPDQWVVILANWIHCDFNVLSELAAQLLSISSCVGLTCCLTSILLPF